MKKRIMAALVLLAFMITGGFLSCASTSSPAAGQQAAVQTQADPIRQQAEERFQQGKSYFNEGEITEQTGNNVTAAAFYEKALMEYDAARDIYLKIPGLDPSLIQMLSDKTNDENLRPKLTTLMASGQLPVDMFLLEIIKGQEEARSRIDLNRQQP